MTEERGTYDTGELTQQYARAFDGGLRPGMRPVLLVVDLVMIDATVVAAGEPNLLHVEGRGMSATSHHVFTLAPTLGGNEADGRPVHVGAGGPRRQADAAGHRRDVAA